MLTAAVVRDENGLARTSVCMYVPSYPVSSVANLPWAFGAQVAQTIICTLCIGYATRRGNGH